MKTLALLLITLFVSTTTFAKIDPSKYSFPQGYEFALAKLYPGYSVKYIIAESKEKTIKKSKDIKESYIASQLDANGKSMIIDGTPDIGNTVLEFEGKYWFNASKGLILLPDVAPAQPLAYTGRNGGSQGRQSGSQQDGPSGIEKAAIISSTVLQVGGAVMDRIGGRNSSYGGYPSSYSTGGGSYTEVRSGLGL